MKKTYKELIKLKSFDERLHYLATASLVGDASFGYSRYLNQSFYKSKEWRDIRAKVIARDGCCDMGLPDRPLYEHPIIHHINPITIEDVENGVDALLDMDNLITVSKLTHNAIHYGTDVTFESMREWTPRTPNDTTPWK